MCADTRSAAAPRDSVRLCLGVPDSRGVVFRTWADEWSKTHGGFGNELQAASISCTQHTPACYDAALPFLFVRLSDASNVSKRMHILSLSYIISIDYKT